MLLVVDATERADINVLGVGRTGVHADLAAYHDAGIGLPHDAQRHAIRRDPVACDSRWSARQPRTSGIDRCGRCAGDSSWRSRSARVDALRCCTSPRIRQRDKVPIGRRVRDIAGAEKRRCRKTAPHAHKIIGALRQHVAPGRARALRVRRRQHNVLPRRIEVPIVPRDIFIDHGARGRMRGDVIDLAFADDPDLAPVAQSLPILGAGPQSLHLMSPRQLRAATMPHALPGSPARSDRWSPACRARARRAARVRSSPRASPWAARRPCRPRRHPWHPADCCRSAPDC